MSNIKQIIVYVPTYKLMKQVFQLLDENGCLWSSGETMSEGIHRWSAYSTKTALFIDHLSKVRYGTASTADEDPEYKSYKKFAAEEFIKEFTIIDVMGIIKELDDRIEDLERKDKDYKLCPIAGEEL